MEKATLVNKLKTRELWGYASGEGVTSITMNGIGNFAMLFYTQILGMSPELVGIALFIATIWDAITDPLMGTISDRTNSRFGRRQLGTDDLYRRADPDVPVVLYTQEISDHPQVHERAS